MRSGKARRTPNLLKHVTDLEQQLQRGGQLLGSNKLLTFAADLRSLRMETLGMNVEEYQHRAAQLSFYVADRDRGNYNPRELDLAVLGMGGEFFAEVEDCLDNSAWKPTEALLEELGDFMWYLALYATWHKISLSRWASFEIPKTGKNSSNNAFQLVPGTGHGNSSRSAYMRQIRRTLGRIQEDAKKALHGSQKPYKPEDVEKSICTLYCLACNIMLRCRLDPGKVYAYNIKKLEGRSGKTTTWRCSDAESAQG